MSRRVRHVYDERKPADMVKYHVIRSGVDEEEIARSVEKVFESLRTVRYWSNQSALAHKLGTRLRVANTFGIVATGYRAPE